MANVANVAARMKGFITKYFTRSYKPNSAGQSSKSSKKPKAVVEEKEVDPRKIPDMQEADET